MNYYGTELNQAGHHFWDIDVDVMRYSKISLNDVSFNPEKLTEPENRYFLKRGTIRWHSIEDYTICAIEGSCKDSRPGSKSVFWVKENISYDELKELILSTPICNKIIEQMDFDVIW